MRISAGMARHAGERRRISCAMEVHFLKKLLAPLVGDDMRQAPITRALYGYFGYETAALFQI